MICKLCNKDINEKFYLHLNSIHKMRKSEYLKLFPEQIDEYKSQVPTAWNKGETKETNPSIASGAAKLKQYCNKESVKKIQSERMKKKYEKGDILDSETRSRVVAAANSGWVKKLKEASFEERKKMLSSFTSSGNDTQIKMREKRTPEDYQRLYPFAKGKASWAKCDFCCKEIIIWMGGKPRPKRRFCSKNCSIEYRKIHPNYVFSESGSRFYSVKMDTEFFLRSRLELWFAEQLDSSQSVKCWAANILCIKYDFEGKVCRYYPDFFINNKFIVELKSGYFHSLQKEKILAKNLEANNYALLNGLEFMYWQFNDSNMTRKKFINDFRVTEFLQNVCR